MRSIRLLVRPSPYDPDELGFILKDMPFYEEPDDGDSTSVDRTGLVVAHDLLEHQNGPKRIGEVWDELEALGGIWYVRGQWGNMMTEGRNWHPPAYHIASDVERMWQHWDMGGRWNGPGDGRVGTRPHDYDEDFSEIISSARELIRAEHRDMGRGDDGEDENGWTDDTFASVDEYLRLALHRMRHGFNKAKRRYERDGGSRYNGHNLFYAVKEAVKAAAVEIEYEGQEFLLRYGNGEATCRPIFDDMEY